MASGPGQEPSQESHENPVSPQAASRAVRAQPDWAELGSGRPCPSQEPALAGASPRPAHPEACPRRFCPTQQ